MRRTWTLTPALGIGFVLAFTAGCASNTSGSKGSGSNSGGQNPNAANGSGAAPGSSSTGSSGGTTGSSGGNGTAAGGSGAASAGTSGSTGASGSSGSTTTACPTTQLEPTPLRRLTKFEYQNTVEDLLKVDATAATTDMPADEVSNGFDNDSEVLTVSSLHAEKYVEASETLAHAAVQNLGALTTCDTTATGEDACALAFAKSFGRRAFRRPTTSNDEQALMTAYQAGKNGGSYQEGIEVMIRAALQSPDFIYRLETTTPADPNAALVPLSQFELATRLSYMIWAQGPDDALLDMAQNNGLSTRDQVAAQARAMLNDDRAKVGLANFFNQWSGVTRLSITTKNTDLFPSFSDDMKNAMAAELPAFMQYVLFQGDHTLTTLLTKPVAFVSGPLGQLYGLTNAPTGTTPQMVELPAEQGRSGLLTQAGFLSVQAHPDQTSPVLRGKFVRTMLLCDPPPPPPADVNISLPATTSANTARERFSSHAEGACASCHSMMDPIGFAFENFDAMGQYRTTENGETIDASGVINAPQDPSLGGNFVGVQELAQKLAGSYQVTNCVATQWFRYASGRLEAAPDSCSIQNMQSAFSAKNGDLIELVVAMTQTDDFWYRAPVTQ
ncbi:MAG TPA: DUF1592 domain-containing protein [Polyangiaceae bacterium]|nr:DUF1592 domain-containing protein [Polyangiaceae bacterium]